MAKYQSKTVVDAIQNLGGENDEDILEFFNETKVSFQVLDDHLFEVYSRLSRSLWSVGKWLVVYSSDDCRVMTNAEFNSLFHRKIYTGYNERKDS